MFITQVLSVDSEQKRLKDLVLAATREQRFEKITKDLKVTRIIFNAGRGDEGDRNSIIQREWGVQMYGRDGASGSQSTKSSASSHGWWNGSWKKYCPQRHPQTVPANAVVVEADAFKETDVIYRALSSRGHHNDMLQTAELVHQNSTDAASSLLVTALNEKRRVIMDGTLSWEPFVEQTIAMARNVHKHRYRMGEGYKVAEDGSVTENYWEQGEEASNKTSKPYRIELVGVVCDPYLAVVRGIRRAISTGRAVRVQSQLKSLEICKCISKLL
ncbi:hypothetical protein HAX54_033982 [Datura stramonium]|uniref:Zeta toxin domain-containing protein n=1 Tax=Datura stramonium TaxID=4076 RepID=A0ABS8VD77_DATST|nr:hypothetical protein [Datura stramonium]